ncbi:MAG: glycine--tRNA ligase subunit beta [Actinomycetota bacterium]|nr:glycine--tRNA ligase subunit beta [Actinomycetota bacterium]
MGKDLLFEIGTEELPPSCMEEGVTGLRKVLENKLSESRLEFRDILTYVSPRRFTAIVKGLGEIQKSKEEIVTGPPAGIAFDKNGRPTKAAEGFARSLNLRVSDLEEIEIKGKGLYLGKRITEEGKKTKDLLGDILKDSLLSMSFSKQMTWSDYDMKFVRPIRWILALYNNEIIRFNIINLTSGNVTFGHRTLGPGAMIIKNTGDYFKFLKSKGAVIVDSSKRRELILRQINKLEEKLWKGRYKVVLNEDLLKDIVNLVEIPNTITGNFPREFLYMPKELLIEAIQHHQKYFAVLDKSGNVSTRFIIVQNGIKDTGGVKKGNERVLKARLKDAAFFYEEDRKHDFGHWTEKLNEVIFFSGLGSMYDKAVRLKKLSIYLADLLYGSSLKGKQDISPDLVSASLLCKCDLVTSMVVEFPALQGIVGRQYAREKGEKSAVADAIFEHYLPRFAGDILPSADVGLILSIADKIDTITGMFIAGEIPSGSADPFALRRKASGIVLSVLKGKYDFELAGLIDCNIKLYFESFNPKDIDGSKIASEVRDFIIARLRFLLEKKGKRPDILDAVLESGCGSIMDIYLRYAAIEEFIINKDIKRIYFPMTRCRNIIGKKEFGEVKKELLAEEYEKKLFSSIEEKKSKIKNLVVKKEFTSVLTELDKLGTVIDQFFDKVLVMDKDEKIKTNRINLIKKAVDLYMMIADFSKLVVDRN